ncbi:PTS system mannose/fructose/sorbose family transporter subunit IID [Lachnospiraceae bacterium 62-35]
MSENEKKIVLDKKTLFKSWFIGINFFNNAHSYQRMFGCGFTASMLPVLSELYDQEEMAEAMKFYSDKYYITEPSTGMVINAILTKMEESKANGAEIEREDMEAVKSGLMGALAGFGDTIFTSTLRPVGMAIFTPMALAGNVLGPLGFWLTGAACRWVNGAFWYTRGLKLGTSALDAMMEGGNTLLRKGMDGMAILSMFVMGAMSAKYVTPKFALTFTAGETTASLQTFLDGALPGILPLAMVFVSYYLMDKKKVGATRIIMGLLVICILGALAGLF